MSMKYRWNNTGKENRNNRRKLFSSTTLSICPARNLKGSCRNLIRNSDGEVVKLTAKTMSRLKTGLYLETQFPLHTTQPASIQHGPSLNVAQENNLVYCKDYAGHISALCEHSTQFRCQSWRCLLDGQDQGITDLEITIDNLFILGLTCTQNSNVWRSLFQNLTRMYHVRDRVSDICYGITPAIA